MAVEAYVGYTTLIKEVSTNIRYIVIFVVSIWAVCGRYMMAVEAYVEYTTLIKEVRYKNIRHLIISDACDSIK